MGASDIAFSPAAMVVITGMVGALVSALAAIFWLYKAARDEQVKDALTQRDSYQKLNKQLLTVTEEAADRAMRERGEEPLARLAPVKREHNSPVTDKQEHQAQLYEMKARAAAAALALGIPLKEIPADNTAEVAAAVNAEHKAEETVAAAKATVTVAVEALEVAKEKVADVAAVLKVQVDPKK